MSIKTHEQRARQAQNQQNKMHLLSKYLIFAFISTGLISHAQNVSNVKIYMVRWNAKYSLIRTVENIKENNICFFESSAIDLTKMFRDYQDCVNKLKSQDTIKKNNILSHICVELVFDKNIVSIFFSLSGDFYFENQWHKMNPGLYYYLFRYFSDEIIPPDTFSKAKLNTKGYYWRE